jgi:hypothetical protein
MRTTVRACFAVVLAGGVLVAAAAAAQQSPSLDRLLDEFEKTHVFGGNSR